MDKLDIIKKKIAEFEAKSAAKEEIKAFTTLVLSVLKTSKETFDSVTKENLATISEALKYLETEHAKLQDNVSQVTEEAKKDFENSLSEIKDLIKKIQTIKPIDGVDGYTPVKGEDYFTEQELKDIKDQVLKETLKKIPEIDDTKIIEKVKKDLKKEKYISQEDLDRAISILDQRTSFLLQKQSTGGGTASAFTDLTDAPNSYTGQALKVVRVNAGETGLEFTTVSGGGDALKADPLSQFAATTSAQLAGVISDETGSGALVFGTNPTFTTRINSPELKATGSSGVTIANNAGTAVADFGTAGSTNATIHGAININTDSADYIQFVGGTGSATENLVGSSTDIDKVIVPKGAGKFKVTGNVNISGLTASQIVATNASKDLVTLDTTTYPSLTELSYVKGVTSAIQTQLNAKQPLDTQLTDLAGLSYTGNANKYIRVNAGETGFELATVAGGGDVTKVGTPANNQIGVWTGDGTIEGDTNFTWDASQLGINGNLTFGVGGTRTVAITNQTASNTAGNTLIIRSAAGNGSGAGGLLNMIAGDGGATGTGGDFQFEGGDGGGSGNGRGGNITFFGGVGAGSGTGGSVYIGAGDSGDSGTGGSIQLSPGYGYGGTNGVVSIYDPSSGRLAKFNTASIATSDKTFTFPNQSGTFALTANPTDITVPDEAYGVGWDGSLEVPTKNALYDKIETLTGGGLSESLAIAYAVAL